MGDHYLLNLFGCDPNILNDEEFIIRLLDDAAYCAKMTVLDITSHKFYPQGVTVIVLLAESHMSIHTWPENGIAVCDVFTCGDHTNPRSGATYMYEAMGATDIVSEIFTRPLK